MTEKHDVFTATEHNHGSTFVTDVSLNSKYANAVDVEKSYTSVQNGHVIGIETKPEEGYNLVWLDVISNNSSDVKQMKTAKAKAGNYAFRTSVNADVAIDAFYAIQRNGINLAHSDADMTMTALKGEYDGALRIPENVTFQGKNYATTSIAPYAFSMAYCSEDSEIDVPESIVSIGDCAFYNPNLKSLKVNWETPLNISADVFCMPLTSCSDDNIYRNCTLYVPEGTLGKYRTAPVWCRFEHIMEVDGDSEYNEIASVEASLPTNAAGTYTLDGRKISDKALRQNGVYVHDGKKLVVQ